MRIARALAITCVLLAGAFGAGEAAAHPLGNFSVNHLTEVEVSRDRVEALYVLDQAEIPTFQERGLSAGEVLARKRAEVERGLRLEVDGRAAPLRPAGAARIAFPAGQGGLKLTRVELPLVARVSDPRRVGAARRHLRGPRRVEGDRGGARRRAPPCAPRRLPATPRTACAATRRTRCRARSTSARRRFAVRAGRRDAGGAGGPGAGTTTTSRGERRLRRASSATPPRARACCCSCCWRRSAGARCTRCRPATARRWSPRT